MVYVISKNEKVLMPTNNNAKVRVLLKNKKAKIINLKPFTIQLLYDTKEQTEATITSIDTGRKHIAITVLREKDGNHLFSVVLETRNMEVPKLIKERRLHRGLRRQYRRVKKVRLATVMNTVYFRTKFVKEIGTSKCIPVKYISKKPARFSNRIRPQGWLTPTANHLLQTHLSLIKYASRLVPITKVGVEYAKFDIHKLKNPIVSGTGYSEGDLYSFANKLAYINARQAGKCILCEKNKIKHLHHAVPQSEGGSDGVENIGGLCDKCHDKVHRHVKFRDALKLKLKGMKKEFNSTSILNTVMPKLYKSIEAIFGKDNVAKEYGYETKLKRESYRLSKEHYNDSYAMALSACSRVAIIEDIKPFELKHYSRHNRQVCYAVTERSYRVTKETIAQNRHKRENQVETDSLAEYKDMLIATIGKDEAIKAISKLIAIKSTKRIRTNPKEMVISLGCVVLYNGKREVVSGMLNKGKTLRLVNYPKKNIGLKECQLLKRNTGLVCM